ncbi:right-handed parallel beta-helix repeat-containing protein [Arthrobacter oryzae]|uniref:right-handed parallel beta-helix repeat-containing protein n=1 Tax=Arthrobacter oryzae TaxID=409290 RepID=UPI002789AA5E|nr:right-handed parallel beta-helix repeat-containing protein [Arthrobacter oryzae]MDQ0078267.1 hypothetical protein [Arthrobacter oryzae]
MPKEIWFDRLGEALTSLAKYSAPVIGDASALTGATAVTVRPFGPYLDGTWKFSRGLSFDMPEASPSAPLLAMTVGSIRFLAGASGAPGRVVLARGDGPSTTVARAQGVLPAWYPQPAFVVYENVPADSARAAVVLALKQDKERDRVRKRLKAAALDAGVPDAGSPAAATVEQLADLWLADGIPLGVSVKAGTRVGTCGPGATGRRRCTVLLVERVDPAPVLFHNLAYHLALWDAQGWIAAGNALLPAQMDTGDPPAGTGTVLFVAKAGSAVPPFATPATASKTIAAAVAAAADGDTVLVADAGTYAESVEITKAVSLTSTATKKATDPSPGYPTITGGMVRRPIRISGVTAGIAHVSRLTVVNGLAPHRNAKGAGGGILVDRVHNAVISSCVLRENVAGGGGIFAEGYGGGICAYHASPAIVGCLIERNHAMGRGSGIGVWGYGWPSIFDCTVQRNFPQQVDNPRSLNDPLADNLRGDGGGIAVTVCVNSQEDLETLRRTTLPDLPTRWDPAQLARARANHVRIVRTRIENNDAGDDGGGLYVSIAANVLLIDTVINNNRSANNGGGIRVTMRSELRIRGGRVSNNTSNVAAVVTNRSGGGGISSRNTTLLDLRGVSVQGNHARGFAGGGVYFISSDEGDLLSRWPPFITQPPFDWNNVLLDPALFAFDRAVLQIDAASSIAGNEAVMLPGQTGDPGKGGGLYVLRFTGPRRATRVSPTITGQPITISVAAAALGATNTSSFPGAARLYLHDQVVPVVKTDTDLPATGTFDYVD